jgi:hypothetical protein
MDKPNFVSPSLVTKTEEATPREEAPVEVWVTSISTVAAAEEATTDRASNPTSAAASISTTTKALNRTEEASKEDHRTLVITLARFPTKE